MNRVWLPLIVIAALLAGCDDPTSPRDRTAPAAPRGLYGVTGDHAVTLHWLANTESDVAGYHVYLSDCATDCKYKEVGATTQTAFTVTQLPDGSPLPNGVTYYYAVDAFDEAGNLSPLSYDDVFDTPRPAGQGVTLNNAAETISQSGYDFSAYGTPGALRAFNDPLTDMYYTYSGATALMVIPDINVGGIQDMGFASSLDAVDFAPSSGWSPTGTAELIPGHNYVLWTRVSPAELHYAKFRVTAVGQHLVTFDWAYQVAAYNRELSVQPVGQGTALRQQGSPTATTGATGLALAAGVTAPAGSR